VKALSRWIVALVASPGGLFVLAALDSTLFVSIPGGLDTVVIILAAGSRPWLVVLLATAGSTLGATLTYWMGAHIGEDGLERYVSPRRLKRVRSRLRNSGAVGLAIVDLIPPPFPSTAFIFAAGALKVRRTKFLLILTACRVLRFGCEASLAAVYGRSIVAWLDSDSFRDLVIVSSMLAAVLTTMSLVKLWSSSRRYAPKTP
jgi:membrane protein YqaA with SNARE-associated domain